MGYLNRRNKWQRRILRRLAREGSMTQEQLTEAIPNLRDNCSETWIRERLATLEKQGWVWYDPITCLYTYRDSHA